MVGITFEVTNIIVSIFGFISYQEDLENRYRWMFLIGNLCTILFFLLAGCLYIRFYREVVLVSQPWTKIIKNVKNTAEILRVQNSLSKPNRNRKTTNSSIKRTQTLDSVIKMMRIDKLAVHKKKIISENEKILKARNSELCYICLENWPNIILFPCLHAGLCKECITVILTKKLECPHCCSKVEKVVQYQQDSEKKEYYALKELSFV